MPKASFKPNDVVRCIDNEHSPEIKIGAEYIVVQVEENEDLDDLIMMRREDSDTLIGGFFSSRFESVKGTNVKTDAKISAASEPKESFGEQGAKYDGGKVSFRALTRGLALPLKAVAAVLTYGAAKYKIDSWQTVPNGADRYEDALDRHLNAWKSGETNDDESGLHHLAHAACNVLFMLWFEMTKDPKRDYTKFNDPLAAKAKGITGDFLRDD